MAELVKTCILHNSFARSEARGTLLIIGKNMKTCRQILAFQRSLGYLRLVYCKNGIVYSNKQLQKLNLQGRGFPGTQCGAQGVPSALGTPSNVSLDSSKRKNIKKEETKKILLFVFMKFVEEKISFSMIVFFSWIHTRIC